MKKTSKWILFIGCIGLLYLLTYLIFIKTSSGDPLFGMIPEVVVYIIPVYFITSIFVEILFTETPNRNLISSVIKALILLLSFLVFGGIYWIFYKYIIVANQLENSFLGSKSDFIFIGLMVFFGIKFSNKLYSK